MSDQIQIARIFQQNPVHAKALGDIYINDEGDEVTKNGYLFILANISNPQPNYEQFLGAFLEKTTTTYYASNLEDSTKLLEYTLNELNKWLPDNLPPNKKILGQFNVVIGNIKDNILNVTTLGDWQAYLIHPHKAVDIFGHQRQEINPVKLFENIITGNLEAGYGLLIANSSLLDYLSTDKLRKIISTIPARSAAEQISNMISGVPTHVSFLSLIIKCLHAEAGQIQPSFLKNSDKARPTSLPVETPRPVVRHSRESIDKLIATETATQKILTTPSSWQTINASWQSFSGKLKENRWLPRIGRGLLKIISYLWEFLKILAGLLLWLGGQIKTVILALLHPEKTPTANRPRRFQLKNFSLKNKVVLSSIIALIIILIIVVIPKNKTAPFTKEELESAETQFTTTEETIEAALIYGDRTRAQTLLTEIHQLIGTLPTDNKKYATEIAGLQERADILTERIWNIMKVTSPTELLDITSILPDSQLQAINLSGDNVFLFTTGTKFIVYNIADKGYQFIDYPGNFAGFAQTAISPDQKILVIDQNKQFFVYANNSLQPVLISLGAGLTDITAAKSFYNRLYILDSQSNQIYRHRLSGSTYLSPDAWLQQGVDFSQATDLAIDGYVYILNGNKIQKFINGREESFSLPDIYPTITAPNKLFTDSSISNFYLLEPEQNRLVIFNKDGELQKQFIIENLNQNLKDFSVQEEAKRLLFINGAKLFILPL